MARYKISDIFFRNEAKGFLCQNSPCPGSLGESCPCALLSVWNYLVLECEAPWQANDGYMTEKVIRNYISRRFLEGMQNLKNAGFFDENFNQTVHRVMKCINSLSTGIELKTVFTRWR